MGFNETVLICDKADPVLGRILQQNGLRVSYKPEITPEELAAEAPGYSIIIVRSRTTITGEIIRSAKDCKIIARVGVGLDNIDLAAAESAGVRVINAVEGATTAVSELVLGMMLCMARQIPRADRGIRGGKWLKGELGGTELKGKYLGIVGLGNIGRRLGRLARGMNMNIIGHDVVPIDAEFSREVGLMKTDLNTLLGSSDYVSLHVPLLDSTRHMINAEKLALMKPTSRIVNTSRGGIIDEDALYEALSGGRIAGAALDVFESEPATGHRLAELDNVILTPHVGAATAEAQSLAANVIGEKIIQILRGVI
ncbi:phosphoglycerate dehydrogenase [Cenarchaeum symbiosum A]|uniref:Phosphoglycerate dehydrogenase n=1 Tax=Cenarchaeum symbiosum (strain A) TaxID=414004 RepID=A0RW58_CENSY|nr:phosphoglycerate dehydrogenase [Cenarchaeum symbiosum A]